MKGANTLAARDILGTRVRALAPDEALAAIEDALGRDGTPLPVAFANAHTLNRSSGDARFRAALARALVLPDGIGLDMASRALHGAAFPANLNGTDFVPLLLDRTARGLRVALLGARPERVALAAAAIRARWPRHEVVAAIHGYRPAGEETRTVAEIAAARPDLLLVAFGNPAQEMWLDRHLARTGARVGMGVGALFDFLSGEVIRAPPSVRRMRLEWAWRLAWEPRRLAGRYLIGNAVFLARVARARLAAAGRGRPQSGQPDHGGEAVADLNQRDGTEREERHAENEALDRHDHRDDHERAPPERRAGDQADQEGGGHHGRTPMTDVGHDHSTKARPDHGRLAAPRRGRAA